MRTTKSKEPSLHTSSFKRFFSGFLVAVMVLGLVPTEIFATESTPLIEAMEDAEVSVIETNEDDGIAPIMSNVQLPEESNWGGDYPMDYIHYKSFKSEASFDSVLFQHYGKKYDDVYIAITSFTGADGLLYSGLCMDHGLILATGQSTATKWYKGYEFPAWQPLLNGVMDYYYAAEYTAREYELAHAGTPNLEDYLVANYGYGMHGIDHSDYGDWWYVGDMGLLTLRVQAQIFLWWYQSVMGGDDVAARACFSEYYMDPSQPTAVESFTPTGATEELLWLMAEDRFIMESKLYVNGVSIAAHFMSDKEEYPTDQSYKNVLYDSIKRMIWFGYIAPELEGLGNCYDDWGFRYVAYDPPQGTATHQRFLIPMVEPEPPKTGEFHAEVTVLKTDESGKGLGGAVFTLYNDSSCAEGTESGYTISTGADGTGSVKLSNNAFTNPDGSETETFWVKETTVPTGYVSSGGSWTIHVAFGPDTDPAPVTAINNGNGIVNDGTIIIETPGKLQKKDAMTGKLVGPATFRFEGYNYTDIYRENIAEGDVDNKSDVLDVVKRTYDMPVGSDGTLDIQWHDPTATDGTYIPPGQYTVTEIVPPPNYEGTDEEEFVDLYVLLNLDTNVLQYEGPELIEFTNEPKTTLELLKLDNSGNGLEGAGFELWYASATGWVMVDSGITLPDGSLTFGGDGEALNAGNYILKEIFAPEGYILPDKTEHEFTINPEASGTTQVQMTITNYKEPDLKVRKVDEKGEGLAGAIIELYLNGISLGQYPTDSEGWIILEAGTYGDILTGDGPWIFKCMEISPPPGYIMPEAYYDRLRDTLIYPGQETAELVLINKPIPIVEFYKRCALTGEALPGAIFNVTIDEHIIYGVMSDKDGKVTISYEEYGEYLNTSRDSWTIIVEEVSAPPGYMLSDDDNMRIQKGEIIAGQTYVTFIFENHPFPEIEILKL